MNANILCMLERSPQNTCTSDHVKSQNSLGACLQTLLTMKGSLTIWQNYANSWKHACNFGSYQDTALCDQLVCGLKDSHGSSASCCACRNSPWLRCWSERGRWKQWPMRQSTSSSKEEVQRQAKHPLTKCDDRKTQVEALTTWQQNVLIKTSTATNATKLDT